MSRDVSLDNPAQQRQDDEFNRWPFSKRLADTIAAFDASEGAPVLGLFGQWGYGKSTILNFIKYELKQEHAEKVVPFEFNPWLFKDQEALLKEFFDGLAKTIDQSLGCAGKRAGEFLAKYGGALQADDLDRLDRDDIMTMLKLVRISANFPHVIYVLAFDDEMVARAAGDKYGGGTEWGRQFLEKIIQYPFSLPAIHPDRLVEFVLRRAKEACTFAEIVLSDDDWQILRRLTRDSLSARLTTPRQAIRYANALRFALPMLRGEVDPLTQMIVEGLRTLFPELYAFARNKYLTWRKQHLMRQKRQVDKAAFAHIMKGSSPDERAAGSELLDFLENRSVFAPRYFDRYLSYSVDPGDISEREVDDLLALTDENKAELFVAELRRIARTNAVQLLDALASRISQLGLQKTTFLVRMLAREGVFFAQSSAVLKDRSAQKEFLHRIGGEPRRIEGIGGACKSRALTARSAMRGGAGRRNRLGR
jgi:hypothetical protein